MLKNLTARLSFNTVFTMIVVATMFLLFAFFISPDQAFAAGTAEGIKNNAVTIGCAAGVVLMVVYLVKCILDYVKGQGNVGKIIVSALVILLLIGFMAYAGSISDGGAFNKLADQTASQAAGVAGDLVGGGGNGGK